MKAYWPCESCTSANDLKTGNYVLMFNRRCGEWIGYCIL